MPRDLQSDEEGKDDDDAESVVVAWIVRAMTSLILVATA